MAYQIDQSGKVEDTNKLTIVALANGRVKSLKISAVEKQKLIKIMRIHDYPKKTFIYKIFASLIFLLLKNERIEGIIIDNEYPGHQAIIKDVLQRLFKKKNKQAPEIMFAEIGKKSIAHKVALEVFRGKRKPDIIIGADDVIKLLY
ncbi:hypothetical protein KKC65_00185 [Patescibacteria group bacterium]|nr:hypothetical protein [Patescibacteria group bacterium]